MPAAHRLLAVALVPLLVTACSSDDGATASSTSGGSSTTTPTTRILPPSTSPSGEPAPTTSAAGAPSSTTSEPDAAGAATTTSAPGQPSTTAGSGGVEELDGIDIGGDTCTAVRALGTAIGRLSALSRPGSKYSREVLDAAAKRLLDRVSALVLPELQADWTTARPILLTPDVSLSAAQSGAITRIGAWVKEHCAYARNQ